MTVDFGLVVMASMIGSTLNVQTSRVKRMFQISIYIIIITVKNVNCEQVFFLLFYLLSHNTLIIMQ